MKIDVAVRMALDNKVGLRRKKWSDVIEIRATHMRGPLDAVVKQTIDHKERRCPNWNPQAEDLMADDWELVRE